MLLSKSKIIFSTREANTLFSIDFHDNVIDFSPYAKFKWKKILENYYHKRSSTEDKNNELNHKNVRRGGMLFQTKIIHTIIWKLPYAKHKTKLTTKLNI